MSKLTIELSEGEVTILSQALSYTAASGARIDKERYVALQRRFSDYFDLFKARRCDAAKALRPYQEAERQIAEGNALFMELLNHPTNPITPEDVDMLVARRPERWGRFAGFGTKK